MLPSPTPAHANSLRTPQAHTHQPPSMQAMHDPDNLRGVFTTSVVEALQLQEAGGKGGGSGASGGGSVRLLLGNLHGSLGVLDLTGAENAADHPAAS